MKNDENFFQLFFKTPLRVRVRCGMIRAEALNRLRRGAEI